MQENACSFLTKNNAYFMRVFVDRMATNVKINKHLIYINCLHSESANLEWQASTIFECKAHNLGDQMWIWLMVQNTWQAKMLILKIGILPLHAWLKY